MNALVRICEGEPRANSRDVAATFEREHKNVLVAIDRIVMEAPEAVAYFSATVFRQSGVAGKEHRAFDMTRDGFALLAMGFTGPKALRWKLAYIEAFNGMEQRLRDADNDDRAEPMPVAAQLDLDDSQRAKLAMVREARIIGGRVAAKRAWELSGLPDIFGPADDAPRLEAMMPEDEHIGQWAAERCAIDEKAREWSMTLFKDYAAWCADAERTPVTLTSFGRALSRMGVASGRSCRMYRRGLRLAPKLG